jgi:hypothetical protein
MLKQLYGKWGMAVTYFQILSSPVLYVLVIVGLSFVFGMCVVTLRKGRAKCLELGFSRQEVNDIIKSSAIYSFVPSLSVIIGLFSLAPALGIPWSWFRLSVVGSVDYELSAADLASSAAGYSSLSALVEENDPFMVGPVMMSMTVGMCGGITATLLFCKAIQSGTTGLNNRFGKTGALCMACLPMALLTVMCPLRSYMSGKVATCTFLTSLVVALIQIYFIRKHHVTWLKNFLMSFGLLMGMISSVIWTNLLK